MQNLGSKDRILRAAGAALMILAGLLAPVPMAAGAVLVGTGVYLLATATMGTCLGYRLMGRSTFPAQRHGARTRGS